MRGLFFNTPRLFLFRGDLLGQPLVRRFHSCPAILALVALPLLSVSSERKVFLGEFLSDCPLLEAVHCSTVAVAGKFFRSWCLQRKVSAAYTPILDVTEFLVFLLDNKKLSFSSIWGYRSMIASVQPAVDSDLDLSVLVKAFVFDLP